MTSTIDHAMSAPTHVDQALSILQGTNDGDDLASEDLCLVETVVNCGLTALTEEGQRYWQGLFERVSAKCYVKPWLHGQEHLTKSQDGYVFWKDKQIEHYSFRDKASEARAAKELAQVCRTVESRGMAMTWASCSRIYDEARFGQGLSANRYHAFWHFTGDQAHFTAIPEASNDLDVAKKARASLAQATCKEWGLEQNDASLRSFFIGNANDHADCLKSIRNDILWAQMVLRSRIVEQIEAAFTQQIDPGKLTSVSEFSRHVLATHSLEAAENQTDDSGLHAGVK